MNRLNGLDISNKKLASFDVRALFINVPVKDALQAIKLAIRDVPTEEFPVPKPDFLKLVGLCLDFQAFSYEEREFAQVNGLAMGSPLSPVAACLYMEMLEKEHFIPIMGPGTIWYRYVDDVLVVVPQETDLERNLEQLNAVEERIQFTLEVENEDSLPFLDIMMMKSGNVLKYKVYRKNTNREDYIHYLSAHSEKVKSGVVIGFLRAYRICSDEHLDSEIDHIFHTFMGLGYPKAFIIRCLRKSKQIKTRAAGNRRRECQKVVAIPSNRKASVIADTVRQAGVELVEKSGLKINEIVRKKKASTGNDDSIVYSIPCKGCSKSYVGETYRGIKKRITEHRRDVCNHNLTNSLVIHIEEKDHLPDWNNVKVLWKGKGKRKRKFIEAAVIECLPNINSKRGDYAVAPILGRILWKTQDIKPRD